MNHPGESNLNLPFLLKEENPFVDRFLMTLAYMRLTEFGFGAVAFVAGIMAALGKTSWVLPATVVVIASLLHVVKRQVTTRGTNIILNTMPDAYALTPAGQAILAQQFGMSEEEFKKNIRQKQLRGDDLDLSTLQ